MKSTLRWSAFLVAIITTALSGLFLSDAFARQKRVSPKGNAIKGGITPSAPIYVNGNFTFTAPQELTGHPPSPARAESNLRQPAS